MRLGVWRWAALTAMLAGLKACGRGDGGDAASSNEGGAPHGAGGEPVAVGGEAPSQAGAASLGGSGNVVPMPVACEPPVAGEPGQLDPSFEPGAKSLGDFSPYSAEFDRKGRLLVVGSAT